MASDIHRIKIGAITYLLRQLRKKKDFLNQQKVQKLKEMEMTEDIQNAIRQELLENTHIFSIKQVEQ